MNSLLEEEKKERYSAFQRAGSWQRIVSESKSKLNKDQVASPSRNPFSVRRRNEIGSPTLKTPEKEDGDILQTVPGNTPEAIGQPSQRVKYSGLAILILFLAFPIASSALDAWLHISAHMRNTLDALEGPYYINFGIFHICETHFDSTKCRQFHVEECGGSDLGIKLCSELAACQVMVILGLVALGLAIIFWILVIVYDFPVFGQRFKSKIKFMPFVWLTLYIISQIVCFGIMMDLKNMALANIEDKTSNTRETTFMTDYQVKYGDSLWVMSAGPVVYAVFAIYYGRIILYSKA